MFYSEITALISVVVIDLVLAGDNAVVVGMAAAGLRPAIRHKAIIYGIAAAAALRIVFAVFTTQLLGVLGLGLAGGLLLLWVTWKLWREIRAGCLAHPAYAAAAAAPAPSSAPQKTFGQALGQIVIADVSMSLDNVLAVAGTARHHIWVLVIGLTLSVALMGVAATVVANILRKVPWISYLGLILIAVVAVNMIWDGGHQVASAAAHAGLFNSFHPILGGR